MSDYRKKYLCLLSLLFVGIEPNWVKLSVDRRKYFTCIKPRIEPNWVKLSELSEKYLAVVTKFLAQLKV